MECSKTHMNHAETVTHHTNTPQSISTFTCSPLSSSAIACSAFNSRSTSLTCLTKSVAHSLVSSIIPSIHATSLPSSLAGLSTDMHRSPAVCPLDRHSLVIDRPPLAIDQPSVLINIHPPVLPRLVQQLIEPADAVYVVGRRCICGRWRCSSRRSGTREGCLSPGSLGRPTADRTASALSPWAEGW